MATKNCQVLRAQDKQDIVAVSQDNQYSNLNLNQNFSHTFSELSKTVSAEKRKKTAAPLKLLDFTKNERDSHSWNKSQKDFSQYFENDGFEKEEIGLMKGSCNSSTLSLHITAYENLIHTSLFKECLKQNDLINEEAKQIFNNSSVIQNPFEFPRQRENDDPKTPEVAQYKASQQLQNPNQKVSVGAEDSQETSRTRRGTVVKIDGEKVDLRNLKFNTKYTVTIKASEMPPEMIEKAVSLADEAMQKYNDDGDIAQHIKHGFDMISPPWHCVVGRKFSSLITHEHGYFLYFFIGKLACVLFKARD